MRSRVWPCHAGPLQGTDKCRAAKARYRDSDKGRATEARYEWDRMKRRISERIERKRGLVAALEVGLAALMARS